MELPRKERVIPYTDALFREAAIEWLVATEQVNETYSCFSVNWTVNVFVAYLYSAPSSTRAPCIP